MTLTKAIDNLIKGRDDCGMIPPEEYTLTIDMAIAGLSRIRHQRLSRINPDVTKLPGETIN